MTQKQIILFEMSIGCITDAEVNAQTAQVELMHLENLMPKLLKCKIEKADRSAGSREPLRQQSHRLLFLVY